MKLRIPGLLCVSPALSGFVFALTCASVFGFSEIPWKKMKEQRGILTYQKSDGSSILQVKGVVIIDARIDVTGGIFRDISMHPKWVGYCEEARVLDLISPKHYILYEVLSPPFPVSKRDLVIESLATYYEDEMKVSINSFSPPEPLIPESHDYVRIKDARVKIDFEYISENKTGVSYELQINPAGHIPPFIVNIFNQIYIFQNMQNLKNFAYNKQYIQNLSNKADTELFEKLLANPDVLKKTLKDRLSRYIRSGENIELLANDPLFFKQWRENKYNIADDLFLGNYEDKYRKKALQNLIKIFLERYQLNDKQISRLANDPKIVYLFTDEKIENKLSEALRHELEIQF